MRRIVANAVQFVRVEFPQALFDEVGEFAVNLPAVPDRPQQKLRVVEMPQQPARQMGHDGIPTAVGNALVRQHHRRRVFVIVVPARAGHDAEAAQVGASIAFLAERLQPVQRRDRIVVGEAFGG